MARWEVKTDLERFEDKYTPVTESGCWIWLGAGQDRYGSFYFPSYPVKMSKDMVSAHKAAMYLYKDVVPGAGEVLLHSCDNGFCCNPDHLKLGTQLENMEDMAKKRRYIITKQILSDCDVDNAISLRESGMQIKDIAEMFGISSSQMSRVTRKLTHQYAL